MHCLFQNTPNDRVQVKANLDCRHGHQYNGQVALDE